MSRRNFILLIIVLVVVLLLLGLFLYSRQAPGDPGDTSGGFFSNLNPFGNSGSSGPYVTPSYGTPEGDITPGGVNQNKLMRVSSMPVAGYTVFQKERTEKEFVPAVRYVDRATGNIYQSFADDIQERKFSTTVIPKVYEALFAQNGDTVVMRNLKTDDMTIQTFLGNLPKEKLGEDTVNGHEIRGSFLPDNVSDLSISPDTTKLFYLLNSESRISGITLNLADNRKTQIFDSPFTEWISAWGSPNTISLTTKASGVALGYVYTLDLNKKFSKTLGDVLGLTTLPSQSGSSMLYSDSSLSLKLYDLKAGESRQMGLSTLAEKCVWSKGSIVVYCAMPKSPQPALYPDAWYQGEISFNDQIWKIDTQTGINTLVLDPPLIDGGEEVDAVKLSLDASESYLFFVNKKDSFLWKLDLK